MSIVSKRVLLKQMELGTVIFTGLEFTQIMTELRDAIKTDEELESARLINKKQNDKITELKEELGLQKIALACACNDLIIAKTKE